MKKIFFLILVFSAAGCFSLSLARQSFAQTLEALAKALPRQAGGWNAQEPDGVYDAETIFDYIDGAGEVYRAYNMRGCLSRRYEAPGEPSIVLDIFDMGSSADAFGVFTHDRDGEPLDLGQGALSRPGWLSFWKGRFFVSIFLERETAMAKQAATGLARNVDSLIRERGPEPQLLRHLPPAGLLTRTVRYFHHPLLLNYHFFLSDENLLSLGPEADAVLASYKRGEERAKLLLVRYTGTDKAEEARKRFASAYIPEGGEGAPVLLENRKWSAAARKGKLLPVVLDADSRTLVEDLLHDVKTIP